MNISFRKHPWTSQTSYFPGAALCRSMGTWFIRVRGCAPCGQVLLGRVMHRTTFIPSNIVHIYSISIVITWIHQPHIEFGLISKHSKCDHGVLQFWHQQWLEVIHQICQFVDSCNIQQSKNMPAVTNFRVKNLRADDQLLLRSVSDLSRGLNIICWDFFETPRVVKFYRIYALLICPGALFAFWIVQ
jgi:hypothetical protein